MHTRSTWDIIFLCAEIKLKQKCKLDENNKRNEKLLKFP